MTSTYSTNKGYQLQGTGDNANSWGSILNTYVFDVIDNNMGGYLSISVAGNSNITPTSAQAQNVFHHLTGALTGNIEYILPGGSSANGGFYLIDNATSGAYTVTVQTSGGSGVVVPQGSRRWVYCDGTNFGFCESVPWLPTEGGTGITTAPTDGQLAIGNSSTSGFSLATISAGSNITVTNGHGTISIAASAGTGTVSSVVAGTGLSGGTITTTGTVSLTVPVTVADGGTGLTATPSNGQVAIGNGSGYTLGTLTAGTGATITNGSGSITMGIVVPVTVADGGTGLTTTPSNGQLDIGNGTNFTRAALTAGTGVSITNGSGSITITNSLGSPAGVAHGGTGLTATPSNGQVAIGNGSGYTLGTLTGGTGISVTNGSGSVTLAASGGSPGTLTAGTANTMNPYAISSTATVAHGLGGAPSILVTYLQCLTTNLSYSVGDRVYFFQAAALASEGDATNTTISTTSSLIQLIPKGGGTLTNITAADWELVLVPYLLN